jgi:cytochrome P450/NADPH-cytochrome P450 reductase
VEIDISQLAPVDENHLYQAGDHFEVLPENNDVDVDTIALGFGWVLDSVFEIDQDNISDVSPRSLAANIKGPCSVRNMLKYFADLTSPPSRGMLGFFAAQLQLVSPETAATFKKLIMPDENNNDQYPAFIQKHRTLLDLQRAYPQVNHLDLGQWLASVTVIQPRRYSIACSPLTNPKSVHLAVGVVDDVVDNKHYPGLASSFMNRASAGTPLRASLKSSKNTFSLPQDPSVPIIMIAAGTGLAPFRGFLQERQVSELAGDAVLFFGCRRPDQDYIYQEELDNFSVLKNKFVAFSRLDEKSSTRYVQHQLMTEASYVWNLLFPSDPNVKPASVYICGSGAMSNDVRRTFCNMAISFGVASNDDEADQVIDNLISENRYLCDVWG